MNTEALAFLVYFPPIRSNSTPITKDYVISFSSDCFRKMAHPIVAGMVIVLSSVCAIVSLIIYLQLKIRGMWDQKHGNFLKLFPFPNARSLIKHLAKEE